MRLTILLAVTTLLVVSSAGCRCCRSCRKDCSSSYYGYGACVDDDDDDDDDKKCRRCGRKKSKRHGRQGHGDCGCSGSSMSCDECMGGEIIGGGCDSCGGIGGAVPFGGDCGSGNCGTPFMSGSSGCAGCGAPSHGGHEAPVTFGGDCQNCQGNATYQQAPMNPVPDYTGQGRAIPAAPPADNTHSGSSTTTNSGHSAQPMNGTTSKSQGNTNSGKEGGPEAPPMSSGDDMGYNSQGWRRAQPVNWNPTSL